MRATNISAPRSWLARCDELLTGKDEPVDVSDVAVSMNRIELQDCEVIAAGRPVESSVADVPPAYRVLAGLQAQLD